MSSDNQTATQFKLYDSEIYGIVENSDPHCWDGQPWVVTYGYDGGIDWPPDDGSGMSRDVGQTFPDDPTADDMRKLADMMIGRWTRFKESLS